MSAPRPGEAFNDDVRRALPKELVQRLAQRSPARAAASVLQEAALIAGLLGAGLTFWPNPVVVALCVVLIGSRQHALFVLAHDAAHYLLFERRWLNDLVGRLCAGAAGLSMCTYRVIHRLHHNHLYGALDPDTALHGGYPRGTAYLVRKLLKDLAGLTAWKTYAYFLAGMPAANAETQTAMRPLADTSPRLRAEARTDRNIVVAFHALLLVAAAWSGVLAQYLVLWILPLATVVQAILRLRAVAEHGAPPDLSSPLTAARTNVAPRWLLWLLFPHHVNYHIEHHVYASVPHYNLPELHQQMRAHGALQGAEVSAFRATLGKIFAPRPL